jgi:hypothetical protein
MQRVPVSAQVNALIYPRGSYDAIAPERRPPRIEWQNVPVGGVFYDKGAPHIKYSEGNSMDRDGNLKCFKRKHIVSLRPDNG